MTITQGAFLGDSIIEGTTGAFDVADGGKGCLVEQMAELLADLPNFTLVGPGFRGVWFTDDAEWTTAGTWATTASTDAFDKALFGDAVYGANGSTATRTWTKPARWRRAVVGFSIYYVDYTSAGNWQYRVDGGTWTNMGQAIANNNTLHKVYVASSVTSTVDVRQFDGSSSVGICLVGIEPFYVDPRSATSGFILHNLGRDSMALHTAVLATSGDRLAWFDAVTIDTANLPSNRPSFVLSLFSNDVVQINNTTTWATDLTTLNTRVSSYATVGFVNVYEQAGGRNTTTQANYRAQTKTTATAVSAKLYDIYDAWSGNGWTGYAPANTAGLMFDTLHPSQLGHTDIGTRLYWFARNQLLGLGNLPTSYPENAKATAKVYGAKAASVVYSACAPVAIA